LSRKRLTGRRPATSFDWCCLEDEEIYNHGYH
jgi:hypothetical protein